MFTNDPTTDCSPSLPIVRTKAGQRLRVILIAPEWRGVNTHYWGGHTVVCPGERKCPACMVNQVKRWQGFIPISNFEQQRFAILQFTPMVLPALRRTTGGSRGPLGLLCCFVRHGSRPNSPLGVTVEGRVDVKEAWTVEQLEHILRRIFEMKDPNFDNTFAD